MWERKIRNPIFRWATFNRGERYARPKREYGTNGNNGTDGSFPTVFSFFFPSVPLFPFVPYSLFCFITHSPRLSVELPIFLSHIFLFYIFLQEVNNQDYDRD